MGSFKKGHHHRRKFAAPQVKPKFKPKKDYTSIQELIKLPNLRKIRPQENLFPQLTKENIENEGSEMSDNLKQTVVTLRDQMRSQFQTFQEHEKFDFTFPQSKFSEVPKGEHNKINYEQKKIVQDEDTFKDRLMPQQIDQIRQDGQFEVKSNHAYIVQPYIWKINQRFFKGSKVVEQTWYHNLSNAYSVMNLAYQGITIEIPHMFGLFCKIPKRIFSLIFGRRAMQTALSVDYPKQLAKDFWEQVMSNHYESSKQWGSEFWEYFNAEFKAQIHLPIDGKADSEEYIAKNKEYTKQRQQYQARKAKLTKKQQQITEITYQFDYNWTKNRKKIFLEVSSSSSDPNGQVQSKMEVSSESLIKNENENQDEKNAEQEILQKFNDAKFSYYVDFLEEKLPTIEIPTGVIDAIITLLNLFQIINKNRRKLDAKLMKERQRIQDSLSQKHKIKSLVYSWKNKHTQLQYRPIAQQLEAQFLQNAFEGQIKEHITPNQKKVIQIWRQYSVNYQAKMKAKRQQKRQMVTPKRTFYSTYLLLPPFKVIHHQGSYKDDKGYYTLEREKQMQIQTNTDFWKCKLYFMRLKCWTINCIVFLSHSCWKGPFGIRCLFGIKDFSYDQTVDFSTGVIKNVQRHTFIGKFLVVLSGIKKSRQHFEGLPDRGLFGKNFSRIFNYLECYVFRLLFVGILISLIIYPILIVIGSVIMFSLILTFWIWMPVIFIITYLFNILIYQFESSQIVYGFFTRAFPLPVLIFSAAFHNLAIVFFIVFALVLCPVATVNVVIFSILSRAFRTFTDFIMLFLIRKLGRTPSKNSALAKKISGPGMSKQFYMSIDEEDVYVLIQSELEKLYMQNFNRIVLAKINKPIEKYSNILTSLIKPYSSYFDPKNYPTDQTGRSKPLYGPVNTLRQKYNQKYINYMARFPKRPRNTRFTQGEIESYFSNTMSITKNFVQKRKIEGWIFEDFEILEDYEELTRKIWEKVFGCGEEIFEPLEKIDQRFKLEEQQLSYEGVAASGKMNKSVNSVVNALQGEVAFSHQVVTVKPYKHSLMNRQHYFVGIQQLFNAKLRNQGSAVYLVPSDPKTVFETNLDIKEAIKYDNKSFQNQKSQLKNAEEA